MGRSIFETVTFIFVAVGFIANAYQLSELTAKADILLRATPATLEATRGPKVTEFSISLIPYNQGSLSPNSWNALATFCDEITITKFDSNWLRDPSHYAFYLESKKSISKEPRYRNSGVDSVGEFIINVPNEKRGRTPVVFFQTWRDRSKERLTVTYIDMDSKEFSNETVYDATSLEDGTCKKLKRRPGPGVSLKYE
ncbi:MAG: hypothetical protein G01um101419_318 [Parcubacteria group bacterium Gr01-1014_19]|nr:MAG: hypothetical protein G01um101419_318 [Parcubacteria group bacterium Gr01-1014_19]